MAETLALFDGTAGRADKNEYQSSIALSSGIASSGQLAARG